MFVSGVRTSLHVRVQVTKNNYGRFFVHFRITQIEADEISQENGVIEMQKVEVFIKRGGSHEVDHLKIDADTTVEELTQYLDDSEDILFFDEDADDPLDHNHKIGCHGHHARFIHRNRCRHVSVLVNYSGHQVEHSFGPGATLTRIQKWTEKELGICDEDAIELGLQITGSDEKPDPSTHVGSLVNCPDCKIEFDLVPTDRINGDS